MEPKTLFTIALSVYIIGLGGVTLYSLYKQQRSK